MVLQQPWLALVNPADTVDGFSEDAEVVEGAEVAEGGATMGKP